MDGTRPGIYRLNLYRANEQPRALLEDITFHEAIPGHHLQMALAMERSEAHPITRYVSFAGFREGWALYAERLADEMGLYANDLDRLGMLASLALRAARLVVDSGLHGLGWTREQAKEYLSENTMLAPHMIEAEVDRYLAAPAEATAHLVGYLEIRRLRADAERMLGDDFDISAFHDVVLGDGAVTLAMLQQNVERWIAEVR